MNTARFHYAIGFLTIVAAVIAIVFYICTFKIIDNDFWWHLKAGEIMWKSGSLIHIEPFSHVLAGQPYTSSHEWLAQLVFYGVFQMGGVTASILLRGLLIAAAAVTLLCIDRRSAFMTAPVIIIVLYAFRASFMVRPQLFTILLLCLTLFLIFRYIQRFSQDMISKNGRRIFFLSILLTQLLWVNLHGGVAIYGLIVIAGFALQGWLDWYQSSEESRLSAFREMRFRGALFGVAFLAMLASPNLFKTFLDLYEHRFDRTIPLVREWMPLKWQDYLVQVFPFGLIGGTALLLRRRAWLLCLFAMSITGMLSLQAYRHCLIFALICMAVAIFQMTDFAPWLRLRERLMRYPLMGFALSLMVLLCLWVTLWQRDKNITFRGNEAGFGVDIPVTGAVDFVKNAGLRGTLFNTYNQGGYILNACSPDCLVFADGRNIQYGYPFLQKLMDSATNPVRWKELDDQYRFTYAIVEYKATPDYGDLLPYINHIAADPTWVLVYLDDSAAVYVRNMMQYSSVINQYAYKILTPHALEFSDKLATLPEEKWPSAEEELLRIAMNDPSGIKAHLHLGDRYLATGRLDDAKKVATDAVQARPYLPEVYELLGRIAVEEQEWSQAGDYLERAAELTNGVGHMINYDYLAMVFSRAGQNDKAEIYHRKALRAGQQSPVRE